MEKDWHQIFESENLWKWNLYLKDLESPDLYITWTILCTVAAALQRRVWFQSFDNGIFANLYTVFVGPPGIGKTLAAKQAKRIFRRFEILDKHGKSTSKIILAPDSVTLEQLTRFMDKNKAQQVWPTGHGKPPGSLYLSSPLAFFCEEELGTLFKDGSHDLAIFLTQGYGCEDFRRETKTQGIDVIINMCITMLGSTTPDWIRGNIATQLMGEGFTSRVVFVYAEKKRKLSPRFITGSVTQIEARDVISKHIEKLFGVFGEVKETAEAYKWLDDWYMQAAPLVNKDKRLLNYYSRKKVHLIKTAMAIHFLDSLDMTLTVNDYERALYLLNMTECEMHKALMSSGRNILYELSMNILKHLVESKKPVSLKDLLFYFYDAGNKTELIEALEFLMNTNQVDNIEKDGKTFYIPHVSINATTTTNETTPTNQEISPTEGAV